VSDTFPYLFYIPLLFVYTYICLYYGDYLITSTAELCSRVIRVIVP